MDLSFGSFNLSLGGTEIMLILGTILPLMLLFRTKKEVRHFDEDHTVEVKSVSELKRAGKKAMRRGHKVVASVNISGVILTSPTGGNPFLPGGVTYGETAAELIDHLRTASFVDMVVVYISTPGGTVPGSQMIFDAINRCRDVKSVYVYIKDLSASGGVMAMVGATKIFAAPGSLIGSIGVIGPTLMRYEEVTEHKGLFGTGVVAKSITGTTVYAGAGKNLGDPYASEAEFNSGLNSFKATIEQSYQQFIDHVCTFRDVDRIMLPHYGAKIFGASEAKELDLIDDIKSLTDFKQYLASALSTYPSMIDYVSVAAPQPRKSGLQRLLAKAPHITSAADVHRDIQQALKEEVQLVIESSYLYR